VTIYEIINPSDAMTIEADDDRVAAAVGILLGEGKIGVTSEDGRDVLPLLLFGGEKYVNEFLERLYPEKLSEFIDSNLEPIAKCLESIVYGCVSDRKAIVAAVGIDASPEAMARFNDAKRSSLNDFSAYAHSLAKRLREKLSERSVSKVDGQNRPG